MKKTNIVLFILIFFATERFCHKQTAGFRTHKIAPFLHMTPHWETAHMQQEHRDLLDQTFHFLGNGGQCYAFVSQDNKYVLKFFKLHHMRPLPWLKTLKLPSFLDTLRTQFLNIREQRSDYIFGSCIVVDKYLKEDTATLHVHINPTDYIKKKVILFDKIGIRHEIDLDTTAFVIQKRADLAYPTLHKLLKSKKQEDARACIRSLVTLMHTRSAQGIADKDPIIKRNFGFIGTKAIEIDIGSFSLNPHLAKDYASKRNLFYEIDQLRRWIRKRYPEALEVLNEELQVVL